MQAHSAHTTLSFPSPHLAVRTLRKRGWQTLRSGGLLRVNKVFIFNQFFTSTSKKKLLSLLVAFVLINNNFPLSSAEVRWDVIGCPLREVSVDAKTERSSSLPPNFTPALTFSADSLRTKDPFEPLRRRELISFTRLRWDTNPRYPDLIRQLRYKARVKQVAAAPD